MGVAVKKGAPKPDISTPEAVKKMLLSAKSISYPDAAGGAAAGVSFEETLKKLGIYDQIQPKIKRAQGGAGAMKMAAKGEVEIGHHLPERNERAGNRRRRAAAESDFDHRLSLVGFVSAHAKDPAAAQVAARLFVVTGGGGGVQSAGHAAGEDRD